ARSPAIWSRPRRRLAFSSANLPMRSSATSSVRDNAASSSSKCRVSMAVDYKAKGGAWHAPSGEVEAGRGATVEEFEASFRRKRAREPVALDFVAGVRAQERELLGGFHALGHHLELQRVRHGDDGGCDRGVVRIGGDVADEFLVDLERVDGQPLEVSERRVAGAEVVDGQAGADGFQFAQ